LVPFLEDVYVVAVDRDNLVEAVTVHISNIHASKLRRVSLAHPEGLLSPRHGARDKVRIDGGSQGGTFPLAHGLDDFPFLCRT